MASTGRTSHWKRLVSISAQNVEVPVIGETTTTTGRDITGFLNVDNNAVGIKSWIQHHGIDAYTEAGSYGPIGAVCTIQFTGMKALARLFKADSPGDGPDFA